ncbi:transcriptional regulator [Bacillus sp. MUM 116]|uniref:LCP family protein n=1 Tax=Bacillus sp. MUM 116 TaxID=1678002 RepID=UPI0008F58772|nr:LCP family protein [Bacillus sp. MUM 116]OIK08708.1 transcriptional regulator [Bacillus sp. MUM 116]
MEKKRKSKRKIVGFSVLVIAMAALATGFQQLQPKNHFKNVPVVSSANTNQTVKPPKNGEFNVLLIGSDQRKGDTAGHSDSMMLVHVDLQKNQYHAASIPRDTRVHLDGYGYTKLTSVQYIMQATKGKKAGVEAAVKAVGELTGVPINYYVETNYWGFQSMVDAIGGIDMHVPFNVTLTHPWYKENKNKVIKAGTHSFDGKMVTEVVHERYSLKNGEYGRQQLQEEAMKGIAKKALDPGNIIKLPSLVQSIPNFVVATNMSTSDMLSLGLSVKDFNPNKQLTYHQLHGVGQTKYDDILKANNAEIVLDPQQLKGIMSKYF